jgi:hypothetical protein
VKKEFTFKSDHSNIEKLFVYAKYKFPKLRSRLEFDEFGQFVFYKKNESTHYFYYVKKFDLWFSVYKNCILKKDLKIIKDFQQKVYSDSKLIQIFDKILKPLSY